MPFEPIEAPQIFSRIDAPRPPVTADETAAADSVRPSLSDTLAASWRTQNEIGSAFAKEDIPDPNRVEDGFSSFDFVKGTQFEGDDDFTEVFNKRAAETLMRQKERERADRRTVEASGWVGLATDFVSGTASPTILMPGGAFVRGVKGGYAVGRAALAVGASAAASAAVQESLLHATQYERTKTETGFAVGASALLGGFIGGGAAALMTRAERRAAERAVGDLTGAPVRGGASPFGASGGAAAVSDVGPGDLNIAGRAASAVAESTAQLNPTLRLNTSPSKAARLYGQQLGENSLYQTGNDLGITAGPAVERLAGNTFHARIYEAEKALDDAYKAMRKSGISMPRRDFEEAAGMAARRGDAGENPYVSQAAKAYRSTILDPFKEEAVSVKLLPDDVKTQTSDSYLHRMWDFQKLTASEGRFKDIVRGWAKGLATTEARKLQETADRRLARIDQEIGEIRMSPEERRLNLWHIEAALQRGGSQPAETRALQQARRRLRFNVAGSQDEIARLNQRIVETDEANVSRLRRMSAGIGRLEEGIGRLDPDVLAKEVAGLQSDFNEILDRSNRASSRVARFLERADANQTEIGDRLLREEGAESARVAQMDRIAARLEDLDSADPEAAIADLRSMIDDRLRQTLDRVSRANESVARAKERIEALDPTRLEKRVKELESRRSSINMDLNERLNIKLDAPNDFEDYAREISDLVYDKLTGRQADGPTQGLGITLGPRGPLKERTFNIPDALVEGFLNNNIVEVGRRYSRLMSGDVELTKRFGSVDLKEPKAKITDEYRGLRERVQEAQNLDEIREITGKGFKFEGGMRKVGGGRTDARVKELALSYLAKRETADLRDLDGLRDLIRGTYGVSNADGAWNRITRAAGQLNYIRLMGGVIVASIGDIYRPAMVHGLIPFMRDGIRPLLTQAGRAAAKMSREDAKRFGLVVERYTQGRLATFAEIGDPYRRGTAVERLLENSTKIANRWNGILLWTDAMKGITSVMSQDRIVRGVLGESDDRFLAYLGISRQMKARISQQIADHGEELDGVWVAHVSDWTDAEAARTYGAALGKDVDSVIVSKSVGDVPLFSNTPTGRLLVQFKSFALASHQKVLLRGLQESPTRFLSGMAGMTALGMMAAYGRAWRGGKERFEKFTQAAENPGYLIGEGLDLAGIFALPMEAANIGEKILHTNVIKDPLKAAFPGKNQQGSSLRYQSRGVASTFLGPSAGLIDLAADVASMTALAASGEATDKQKARAANQAIQLVPFYSYPGMREMVNLMHGDR